jgi:D-alanyl-lipoteichoic acid acyltransferase DltB (MBOAT superfamily)
VSGERAEIGVSPGWLLLVPAVVVVGLALGLDYLHPSSSPGLGPAQWAGVALGLTAVAVAGSAALPWGRVRFAGLGAGFRERVAELAAVAGVVGQVALLVVVIRLFRIESPAFYDRLAPLLLLGFIGHHLLPGRWRLGGFVALSLGAVSAVFGWVTGLWLAGLGLVLIALARLPVSFGWRVAAMAVAGAALALARSGRLETPVPGAIWPILGSMFMFRLVVYAYDVEHARTKVGWRETLAYFFMVPNPAFPLFPVVDFATFRRTYYDRDAATIYQQGVWWMVRGLTHLVIYRFVYQKLTISPSEVTDLAGLVHYALANFGLYLRVSGQFHLIIGILHLFGFRLPETHRFFYLASGFTDFWRRINIYWKDFMTKVVFNPVHFRLRRHGQTTALVLATLAVFVVTWATHAYQWFWILGAGAISLTDTLFWGLLALIMVGASLRELRHGRQRTLGVQAWSWRRELRVAAGTAVTFTLLCVLWTLWSSSSLSAFMALLAAARPTGAGVAAVGATLLTVALATLLMRRLRPEAAAVRPLRLGGAVRQTAGAAVPLVLLCAVALPPVVSRLGPGAQALARDLRLAELNRRDAALLQRGYYEQLVGVNRFNGQLWDVYARRTETGVTLADLGVMRRREDLLRRELVPFAGVLFQGQPFRTNQWGMRDRDYAESPAPGTLRIALLGASSAMGEGLADGEAFESVLEDRLNGERPVPGIERFEVLNFAVRGYTPLSQLLLLEQGRVFRFGPRAILIAGHASDLANFNDLVPAVNNGWSLEFPEVRRIVAEAGLQRGMTHDEMERRLLPHGDALVRWVYGRIAELCRTRGVEVWWTHVPLPLDNLAPGSPERLETLARQAGFEVIGAGDPYAGREARRLILAEWDRHPNAQGHRLLAEHLYPGVVGRLATLDRGRELSTPNQ